MGADNVDDVIPDGRVSRRWLLRSTANLTAGLVAVRQIGTIAGAAAEPAAADAARFNAEAVPDHDPATGEIFDRNRHHHWDTV
jgi:hypothetical protein